MVLGYAKIREDASERLNFQNRNETNLAQLNVHTRKGPEREGACSRGHSGVEPGKSSAP